MACDVSGAHYSYGPRPESVIHTSDIGDFSPSERCTATFPSYAILDSEGTPLATEHVFPFATQSP